MVSRLLLAAALAVGAAHTADIDAGKALFERHWVAAPSAAHANEGLGPLYDSTSCDSCHAGGGAGHVTDRIGSGLLVRLGRANGESDPVYGAQLQSQSVPDVKPEANIAIRWTVLDGRRSAALHIFDLGYGDLSPGTYAALRRAPPLFGTAELASVPDAAIQAVETREHRGHMQGHVAIIADERGSHIGRFGWKASAIDLEAQVATALQRDIGLSTTDHPDPWGECTAAEASCRDEVTRVKGSKIEVPDSLRDQIVAYVASLSAPAPLNERSRGYALFRRVGCDACHTSLKGHRGERVKAYTDLLLHDLGPELDDGIAEGNAKPSEWRTAPLWNVAGELAGGGLLHDGRARDIAEAVRWHGGAASPARARFKALSAADQTAIESFLLGK
jgi:CxxC motif-containing protein (DUF1111 family)